MIRSQLLTRILSENTTERYRIEYGGFLANHISHGIIALFRLGADEARLQRFVDWYQPRLEGPDKSKAVDEIKLESDELERLRGKEKSFYSILSCYEKNLNEDFGGSMEKLIAGKFPGLINGMMAAVFHGLIQVGYGYAARHPRIVCEGLAYIHQSYLPMKVKDPQIIEGIGSGKIDIMEVVNKIRQDVQLREFVKEKALTPEWIAKDTSTTQRYVKVLYEYKSNELITHAGAIQFPEFYNLDSLDSVQLKKLLQWVLDCAITVYVSSEKRNDFFLLHGVTSAWCLMQVLPLVENRVDSFNGIRVYLCGLLATYLAQGAPSLCLGNIATNGKRSWSEIVETTLFEDRDEHIFKLVQICYEQTKDRAGNEDLYMAAAECALEFPLSF